MTASSESVDDVMSKVSTHRCSTLVSTLDPGADGFNLVYFSMPDPILNPVDFERDNAQIHELLLAQKTRAR